MEKIAKHFSRLLHWMIGICLLCMTVFVFSNVVLRYVFNSGLTWAEEASRFLFIWLIFLGAVVALRENAHLGVDLITSKLSPKGKRIVLIIQNVLILAAMALIVDGSIKITLLTMDQYSASTEIPLAFVYFPAVLTSIAMVVICLNNIYNLCTGKNIEDITSDGAGGGETW